MKVIFFDVDGVLNSDKYMCSKERTYINPKNVDNLKLIVDATEAKLVLTSDWRQLVKAEVIEKPQAKELVERLAAVGLEIYDVIPESSDVKSKYEDYSRAFAVKSYIETNNVDAFVIIDDMDMDWERVGVQDHWVDTENVLKGLTEADAKDAIAILQNA